MVVRGEMEWMGTGRGGGVGWDGMVREHGWDGLGRAGTGWQTNATTSSDLAWVGSAI